jgi:hypothetical protein
MSKRWIVTDLIAFAIFVGVIAIRALEEGIAHDQSGFCVIDLNMPPPYLGFEHWQSVGLGLGAVAAGLFIGAIRFGTAKDEFESLPSENAEAPIPSLERDR